ncbi:centrosomal protein of 68 kDa isoform X2 [Varanus komodoensis]|uniref:Centrosomal protein 68 n=2 Tax=Varanus komodoensis TaxID=61221 RepID=A0A8D2JGE0_VARKO|nr:centrosomal protein of 68 kDa isoform X1 [Varanus komodoensis]XP_044310117.1 centrosomal protein of 68 kDa isoform X1 [Varanus komodoensis]XP_044310118.1 centrosomal protein of 68 kDa isoform X1 [Varanus komodoensis]XP_044310119.1 centrosomal protein of 68 kDa isoform X1 [Varanus komodoensis]XP_044310120.1 centrosomal protein of 68 kDa isoform X1 [Varanus komodoensis]XP_044310121.1 centrosomal protein of 68 kDa isoform X1 [Varanus komodoensis]XP_044310122.1 centrosomal protein of 68 kDa is
MALELEKSPFDAALSLKAKNCGRWNYTKLEMNYSALVNQTHQPSEVEKEAPLLRGTEDEEPRGVEEVCHSAPSVSKKSGKHYEMPFMPSGRFCKVKANTTYLERQPLGGKANDSSDGPYHFSRGGLHPEEQQMNAVKRSNSAELLPGWLEVPEVLPVKAVDSAFYSPSAGTHRSHDAGCRSHMAFAPYSSTPKHLSYKRDPYFNAGLPAFTRTDISSQPPEDSDLEQQEMTGSKSFSTGGALLLPETSAPWYRHSLSDLEDTPMVGTRKPMSVDYCSLLGQVRKMSSFQADYWACAIPDSLPPSPDRRSPHWDPNKEYEDLLDYTYPLRPKYKLAKNPKDSTVHDSGVELDTLSISPESTLKSGSVQDQEQPAVGLQSVQRFSTPWLKRSERLAPASHYRLTPVGKVSIADAGHSACRIGISREMAEGLSPQCTGPAPSSSANIGQGGWSSRGHDCLQKREATASNFIPSTQVLPLKKACSSDEEYLSLPPRLKELETLAQQLTDLSLTERKSEGDHVHDDLPCISMTGEHQAEGGGKESPWELPCDPCPTSSPQAHGKQGLPRNQDCRDREHVLRGTACLDFLEARCLEFLEGGSQPNEQEKDHCTDSLAQHIKIFCCQLEELIRWLHKIAEVTDNWIPPKPDIESVKASVQHYLEFKKDLADHQALSEGVLQDGERLLQSIASNSPVLQDTLSLIAKQSSELEGHAARLYESVLAAMDALSAGLMRNCDASPAEAQAESSR